MVTKYDKIHFMKKLTIPAETQRLDEVLAFIDTFLEENDCPPSEQIKLDIAVEEIYVNIASYAYGDGSGDAVITAEMDDATGQAVFTFADSGKPFDPLAKPDPDITLSAEERSIGGLGIFMVKKSMDDVTYVYENGQNILTIRRKIRRD